MCGGHRRSCGGSGATAGSLGIRGLLGIRLVRDGGPWLSGTARGCCGMGGSGRGSLVLAAGCGGRRIGTIWFGRVWLGVTTLLFKTGQSEYIFYIAIGIVMKELKQEYEEPQEPQQP